MDEKLQKQLGHIKFSDDTLVHGAHRHHALGGTAKHDLGIAADGLYLAGVIRIQHHDGGLADRDALFLHINLCIAGAQIDSQIPCNNCHIYTSISSITRI